MLKQSKKTIESLKKYQDQLIPKKDSKNLKGGTGSNDDGKIGSEDILDG